MMGFTGARAVAGSLSVALAVALGLSLPAVAQETVREVQVPLDTAGTVLEIGPELRAEAGLFPDAEGFQAARLFRVDDDRFVLEVASLDDGRLVRDRTTLSSAAAAAFRQRVSDAVTRTASRPRFTQAGRGGLVWRSTALGLGFYGWSVPVAFGIDGARAGVASYLLTAAASFYVPYRLTRDRSVTGAHRSYTAWGATRGALYGGTLGFALTDRGGPPAFDDEDEDEWRVRLGLATVGSVAGGLLGFNAVDRSDIDEGEVALRGTLTDFATAVGFGTAYVLGLYDEESTERRGDLPVVEVEEPDLLPANLLVLGVTGAGLYGASRVAAREDYTVGDTHVLRSVGILGAQALLPAANLVDRNDAKIHVAAAILGAAPALWFGDRLLREQSFSQGDGLIVAAGHLAGGLLGAGLTYLVDPNTERDELIYLTTSAAGSAAGLVLTYRALSAGGARSASVGADDAGARGDRIRLTVDPSGLLPLLSPGGAEGTRVRMPLVTLAW